MQDPFRVALIHDPAVSSYSIPPYSPSIVIPEYLWKGESREPLVTDRSGGVYEMVRLALFFVGLDQDRFGSGDWNPLSQIIKPGDTVLIKPNWVHDTNRLVPDTDCLVTHASLIRAAIDYALLALKGKGRVVIGDAPIQTCSFHRVLEVSGTSDLLGFYRSRGVSIDVLDFRSIVSEQTGLGILKVSNRNDQPPRGCVVTLDGLSALSPLDIPGVKYRVTQYDPSEMERHHGGGRHEYLIAETALASDVVINIAKMKTHRKAGVTGALKNIIGINANKDWLPHHRAGSPSEKGDEYRKKDWMKRLSSDMLDRQNASAGGLTKGFYHGVAQGSWLASRVITRDTTSEGSWPGNDTLWRTVLDVNRILLFADKRGHLQQEPQRKVLSLVDGIIAGEGNGPLHPRPKRSSVIVAGLWAPAVDATMATVMGLDWEGIPVIRNGLGSSAGHHISIASNRTELCGPLGRVHQLFSFVPAHHWESICLLDREE